MNIRKFIYFAIFSLRGQRVSSYYKHFLTEDQNGIPPDTTKKLISHLLAHCKRSVPYYTEVMSRIEDFYYEDPEEYLRYFPILTKDIIRRRFDDLKSTDLPQRKWYFNTSGGSTGEPVRFIQDREYAARSGAVSLFYSKLIGREIGEKELNLWGSVRDITKGTDNWRARLLNKINNTIFLNAFQMNSVQMSDFIAVLNNSRPKLIVSYVDSIYKLAKFAEQERLVTVPQTAIITSAGTLHPLMRKKIEEIFKCRVFNRYGSREVGDIACERPGRMGIWVAPWCNFIEIVDSDGNRVPDGVEGEILVTSLINFAMPLIRYQIGDRGVLSPTRRCDQDKDGQVFQEVVGRTCDTITTKNGDVIHYGYFMVLLFFKDWISQYQVIQKSTSCIVFRIVKSGVDYRQAELHEIASKTKLVMGDDCEVVFDFVDEIATHGSGKYRYIISEISSE